MLVLVGTGAIVLNEVTGGEVTHLGVSIAFGVVVFAMIMLIGKATGAHINPAVTIGFWVANKFDGKQVTPYIIAQLIGAVLASALLFYLYPTNDALGSTLPADLPLNAFLIEFLMTFLLMLGILLSSSSLGIWGVAAIVGSIVGLEAFFGGPYTGASMNPARSFGPAIISGHIEYLWMYFVAPIGGALLAKVVCVGLKKKEVCSANCC